VRGLISPAEKKQAGKFTVEAGVRKRNNRQAREKKRQGENRNLDWKRGLDG